MRRTEHLGHFTALRFYIQYFQGKDKVGTGSKKRAEGVGQEEAVDAGERLSNILTQRMFSLL